MHTENTASTLPDVAEEARITLNTLFEQVYDELATVARLKRKRWYGLEILDADDLIHEVYLKLWNQQSLHLQNKHHFLAIASNAMHQVLINAIEKKSAVKRGGGAVNLSADEVELPVDTPYSNSLDDFHTLLDCLKQIDDRQGRVFECRFIEGMTVLETSTALKISPATVKRDWRAACSWIYRELNR